MLTFITEFLVLVPMMILSLVGVYGNSVVIYSLSNLNKKSHHMLVMISLAFSDFISCCKYTNQAKLFSMLVTEKLTTDMLS